MFITAHKWKPPKCPSTDAWINKMLYIHTMEYYTAMIRNDMPIHVATWMNLKTFF
jgi:hypothetical protein